jgi:regulator of chromosome condensation
VRVHASVIVVRVGILFSIHVFDTTIKGKAVTVTTCSDHNIIVTEEGKAYSWGFSANYQTGQGTIDDVIEATLIDNTAVREKKLNGCTSGGQFSVLTAKAADAPKTNGV